MAKKAPTTRVKKITINVDFDNGDKFTHTISHAFFKVATMPALVKECMKFFDYCKANVETLLSEQKSLFTPKVRAVKKTGPFSAKPMTN